MIGPSPPEKIALLHPQEQGKLVHPIVFRMWLDEAIQALPVAADRLPLPIRTWTELLNSLSLLQATFVWPLFIPCSAALNFASNPFFWVPVSDDAPTAACRF